MAYSSKRNEAIALFRQHCRETIKATGAVNATYRDLRSAMDTLLQEFRIEYDMPGVRYWHISEDNSYFSTEPGETLEPGLISNLAIELTRYEFLSRQGIHFGYEEDRL